MQQTAPFGHNARGGGRGAGEGGGEGYFSDLAGAEKSELAFLGTGSMVPSKFRNVSGIWVRLSPEQEKSPFRRGDANRQLGAGGAEETGTGFNSAEGSMLLDVGEGTFGQLWRMFGDSPLGRRERYGGGVGKGDAPAAGVVGGVADLEAAVDAAATGGVSSGSHVGAQQALRDLSAVWISHPHADHHLGLVRILSERNKLLRAGGFGAGVGAGGVSGFGGGMGGSFPNLLLMAPAPIEKWLQARTMLEMRRCCLWKRRVDHRSFFRFCVFRVNFHRWLRFYLCLTRNTFMTRDITV